MVARVSGALVGVLLLMTACAAPASTTVGTAEARHGGARAALAASSPSPSPSPSSSSSPSGSTGQPGVVDKVLVLVVENKSRGQMVQGLPTVARLGRRYGTTTDYRAVVHPSLPNYLSMVGGSTFGVRDDDAPAAHPLTGPSVLGATLEAGHTAWLYADAMTSPCEPAPSGRYAVKHNPWAYFVDERALCTTHESGMGRFDDDVAAGRLPDVGMVIPDLCDDAHDCDLSVADAWLSERLATVMAGPDWAEGHLAVVVTADEDDRAHHQLVLTVLAHPALHHQVVSTPLDHLSLSRALAEVGGSDPLRHARRATSLLDAFGLTASP